MTAILTWALSNPTIIAIVAGLFGALGWGWKQRRAGAQAERDKQARAEAKARDIADEIQNDVGALPPDEAREALRKWSK